MKNLFARLSVLLVLIYASLPTGLHAQEIAQQRLRFAPGQTQTNISGEIVGRQTIDYLVGARRGQTISIRFAPDNRAAFYNLLAPETGQALFVGQNQGNPRRFAAKLGATGNYVIRIYLVRAAARRGEKANYNLSVSVTGGAPQPEPPVDNNEAMEEGGPDFWVVSGLSAGDSLNMRQGPSTTEPVITTFRNGKVLKNLGCRRVGERRWCRVANPLAGAAGGWVNGRYLRETGGPDAGVVVPEQPKPPIDNGGAQDDGGPDFYVVNGLSLGDQLYMREVPSSDAPVIAAFNNGKVLKNLGCRRVGAQRWCRVENALGGPDGWVNGRYLRESGGPNAEVRPDDALVPGTNYNATGEVECAIAGYARARSCGFGVVRGRNGTARVSITLPDGDTRVLEFTDGQVRSVSSVSAFRFRRSNDSYFINVNNGEERFTIDDAVINGG